MAPKPLFPKLPDDIQGLDDAALAAALDAHLAVVKSIRDGDAEVLGELDAADVTAQLRAAVTEIQSLRAEQGLRETAATEAAEAVAALAKEAGLEETPAAEASEGAEGEGAEGEKPAEGEGEPEGEAVEEAERIAAEAAAAAVEAEAIAASARARVPAKKALRGSVPQPKGAHKPEPREAPAAGERRASIVASGDIPGYSAGSELLTGDDIAKAMIAKHDALGRALMQGDGDKVPVATIRAAAEPERTLGTNEIENMVKIQAVTGRRALAASGGICAPATPYYGLMELAVADRPVRDSLPRFNADRGAIRFATPPGLSIVDDAIGYITAAEDAEGGTFALKSCQAVVCPDLHEVDVAIIYHCTQFGNLGARTWPEQVAQFNELVLAAHARLAEQALLDGIAAASTAVTGAQFGGNSGVTNTVLGQLISAATAYRSRQRMDRNAQLRVMLPYWVLDAMHVDVLRSQFMRFDATDNTFEQELAKANITPTYYMDTPTGAGQVFPAQGAGALVQWPAHVVSFLFAEGSFLYVDGGVLELGIVRDSTLNSHNDYQIFGETFENVAFVGLQSIELTSTICVNGVVSAAAAPSGCAS